MSAAPLNARVASRDDLTPELSIVRIAPEGWQLGDFEPGQWAALGLPREDGADGKLLKRVYSIASAPGEDALEFYIQLVKHGRFTERLWSLERGDALFMDPSLHGTFTLEPVGVDKDLVLIGTGTGLAPFVSMLRHYRGRQRWRRVVIVHGVRHVADLGYREELEAAARDDDVVYLPTVTREPEDSPWNGLRGRAQALLEGDTYRRLAGAPLAPATCHVFLCGNPGMIDDMQVRLEQRGFTQHRPRQPGNLHFERYW